MLSDVSDAELAQFKEEYRQKHGLTLSEAMEKYQELFRSLKKAIRTHKSEQYVQQLNSDAATYFREFIADDTQGGMGDARHLELAKWQATMPDCC